jgi:hypothetical protein
VSIPHQGPDQASDHKAAQTGSFCAAHRVRRASLVAVYNEPTSHARPRLAVTLRHITRSPLGRPRRTVPPGYRPLAQRMRARPLRSWQRQSAARRPKESRSAPGRPHGGQPVRPPCSAGHGRVAAGPAAAGVGIAPAGPAKTSARRRMRWRPHVLTGLDALSARRRDLEDRLVLQDRSLRAASAGPAAGPGRKPGRPARIRSGTRPRARVAAGGPSGP